jgi:hypothetical protein
MKAAVLRGIDQPLVLTELRLPEPNAHRCGALDARMRGTTAPRPPRQ